ncbi:MAG TPA: hypothetical protein DHU96_32115 [Actinobacteria bacterium]|nr:hypothetical protein [Actinomycetota bacterium]
MRSAIERSEGVASSAVRRCWRRAAVTAAVVVVMFAAATARFFVVPAQGMPAHVDAVVVLDGPGNSGRLATAWRLAEQRRAPTLLISRGTKQSETGGCPPPVRDVKVICFNPAPATTQGEAEFAGRLARQHRWKSVALVTIGPQGTRARLRMSRCFAGKIYVVTAPLPAMQWPYEIAYEWGATLKALFLRRSC